MATHLHQQLPNRMKFGHQFIAVVVAFAAVAVAAFAAVAGSDAGAGAGLYYYGVLLKISICAGTTCIGRGHSNIFRYC